MIFDEIDVLVSKRNYSYTDCMNMPTSDRKYFIMKFVEEQQKIEEELAKANKSSLSHK